jgi:hypothetical protein
MNTPKVPLPVKGSSGPVGAAARTVDRADVRLAGSALATTGGSLVTTRGSAISLVTGEVTGGVVVDVVVLVEVVLVDEVVLVEVVLLVVDVASGRMGAETGSRRRPVTPGSARATARRATWQPVFRGGAGACGPLIPHGLGPTQGRRCRAHL